MFEEHEKDLNYCSACPKLCQSKCPVVNASGNESHSPWGLMQSVNMIRMGKIRLDEETAELAYQCTTCRGCQTQCEHGIDVSSVLLDVRQEATRRGVIPKEITGFLEKFHKHNNPFSKDLLAKLRNLLSAEIIEKDSSIAYFPTCTTIAKTPEVVKDTFELFSKLEIDFVGVYPEAIQCCGYPLYSGGLEDEFVDLAEINYHALKKYKTIICASPSCVYTMRDIYSKYSLGLGERIVTMNEFLEPYLHNINFRIKKNIRTKLMYHDSCYQVRYLDDVDLPRELISQVSGYQPIEFHQSREHTSCSGQGGCFSITSQDVSNEIAKKRLEEVSETEATMVLTQCPSCIHKFRKNSNRLVVKDLISYLNDCIEDSE